MKKPVLNLAAVSLFISLSFSACNEDKKEKTIETDPISFTKEGELYLIKASGDTISKLDIEIAESDYEHQTGLMYRKDMKDSQGMLFLYDSESIRNFYMKNTYLPLDIIYYDADSALVSIQKNARPMDDTSLPSKEPAQYVLEVNAGLSDEWQLGMNDKISFKKTEE